MHRTAPALIFFGLLALTAPGLRAQEAAPAVPAAAAAAPAPAAPAAAAPTAAAESEAEAPPTAGEANKAVEVLLDRSGPAGMPRSMVVAAALAVLLRFLLGFAGQYIGVLGRHRYRWAALIVGVVVFGLDRFALGGSWSEAVLTALGGPGAILVNELLKMLPAKKGKAEPPPAA